MGGSKARYTFQKDVNVNILAIIYITIMVDMIDMISEGGGGLGLFFRFRFSSGSSLITSLSTLA